MCVRANFARRLTLKTRARWKETHAGEQQAGQFAPVISIKVI
jgi:hypothetical protein